MNLVMEYTKATPFLVLLMFFLSNDIRLVDADAFVLVADLDNGTIFKGSISQGLADLAPLPLDGVIRPVAVDYDPVEEMVYWTDVGQPSPKISKAHLDGSDQVTLILELHIPAGLALDIVARMVYWTDEAGHIARIPMDGSSRRKQIIVEDIDRPRGIVVFQKYGHIYWADSADNGKIERAHLDGTYRQTIVQDHMVFPSGLAIDHQENQLYWCDSNLETIERKDTFTHLREVVINLAPLSGVFTPFDLVLYNDNIYWSDWGSGTLLRASKSGAGAQHYGPAVFQKAGGVHIHEDVCDSTPCMNGGTCTSWTAIFTCQCALGYSGLICQINFCGSSPCRNGGTCTSSACQCAPGYGGNTCHRVSGCELTHDASGIVTVDPYQPVYLPGQGVILGCPDGYELQGSSEWFCQDDYTWTENQAECIQLDSCGSSPCVNGGTCTSLTVGFICQCTPGHEGSLCHIVSGCELIHDASDIFTVDPYQPVYLPGQGVILGCPDGYEFRGSAEWFCQSDFTWTENRAECIQLVCDSTPCMNGGTCSHLTTGFICQCPPGYGGNLCHLVLGCELTNNASDNLIVEPRQLVYTPGQWVNFGCSDFYEFRGSEVWFCQSDYTWTENQAECISLDFCESSPCMNGGTCTSLPDDFNCQCAPGYEGNLCVTVKQGCFRPPVLSHLTISETESFFQPGDEILFTCDNGYLIEGSNDHSMRRVCSVEDRSWSGGDTQCVIDNQGYITIIIGVVGAVIVVSLLIGIAIKWIRNRDNRNHGELQLQQMQPGLQEVNIAYQNDAGDWNDHRRINQNHEEEQEWPDLPPEADPRFQDPEWNQQAANSME